MVTNSILNRPNESGSKYPVWNYIPDRIADDPIYQSWRSFLLSGLKYDYDFLLTVTFIKRQYDDVVIQSTSHLIGIINSYLTSQRYRQTGRFMEGFAFLERHHESEDKYGGLHVHILGYFPDTFHTKPTIREFESKVKRAVTRVTNRHGNQMISPSEVDVKEPYHERGVVNYLSKDLTLDDLGKNILFVGKDGLTGWEPDLEHGPGKHQ